MFINLFLHTFCQKRTFCYSTTFIESLITHIQFILSNSLWGVHGATVAFGLTTIGHSGHSLESESKLRGMHYSSISSSGRKREERGPTEKMVYYSNKVLPQGTGKKPFQKFVSAFNDAVYVLRVNNSSASSLTRGENFFFYSGSKDKWWGMFTTVWIIMRKTERGAPALISLFFTPNSPW